MACTAVGRYLALSGCLEIIIEAVNLNARLAFIRAPLILITPYKAFFVFGMDNKEEEEEHH